MPLKRPWKTAAGSFGERDGFLVCLRTEEGLIGYGDCAPLVESGTESLAQAETSLRDLCSKSSARTLSSLLEYVAESRDRPATCNAVETAVLDVISQANALPLYRCLSQDCVSAVEVNASVGALDAGVLQRCCSAVAAGYKVVKIKAGIDKIRREINKIIDIIDNIPEYVSLRVDANRSWSRQEAFYAVAALRDLSIECLEEPLREPDRESLQALQDITSWPIAVDESISLWSRAELVSYPPVRRVVCKPAVLGGLREALEFAKALEMHGTETVVTTTLESAAGTWACVHLAAALNNNLAHGLATSDWFAADTGEPPEVRAGKIGLPSTPGLGFVPREG